MENILLIDGSSFLFRAFFAMPQLTNGEDAHGAIYGVINMLKRTMETLKPDQMVVVFDAKGKNFRHDLYPEYKANRAKMPEELAVQIEPLFAMIQAMGLPLVIEPGYGADDVIATLAKHYVSQGSDVLIATGDKDLAQLVNEHIELIDTMKDQRLNEAGVYEKFGVYPHQMIDYLSLIGDVSDHVPGIPKVGPKTAVKWLQEYGSVEVLLQHQDAIKGKVGESLREHQSQLDLSQQLITIKQDVPMAQNPDDIIQRAADQATLKSWYQKLNFKRWSDEINSEIDEVHCRWITDINDWAAFTLTLSHAKWAIIQLELAQEQKPVQRCVGITLKLNDDAIYIPLDQEEMPSMRFEVIKPWLQAWCSRPEHTWVGFDLKSMYRFMIQENIEIHCRLFDLGCVSYLIDPSRSVTQLSDLSQQYLGLPFLSVAHAMNRKGVITSVADLTPEEAQQYIQRKISIVSALQPMLQERLKASELQAIYDSIEMPMIAVLAHMEYEGVGVSKEQLQALGDGFESEMKQLESQAYQAAGSVFNLQSTKQLRELLYDVLGLPVLEKPLKAYHLLLKLYWLSWVSNMSYQESSVVIEHYQN